MDYEDFHEQDDQGYQWDYETEIDLILQNKSRNHKNNLQDVQSSFDRQDSGRKAKSRKTLF